MSKYTTQLRYICEQKAGYLVSTDDYNEAINKSYDKIIHPETDLYDPAYAPVLYKKILRHYYFDEIAHETVGQFIMRLNTKLDEILPYYNKLYESAVLEYNPLYDVDYTVTGSREDNGTNDHTRTDNLTANRTDDLTNSRTDNLHSLRTDNLQDQRSDNLTATRTDNLTTTRTDDLHNEGSSTAYKLFSDTPEGSLTGVDNESYLTNAEKDTTEAEGSNTGTQTTLNTGTETNKQTGTQTNSQTGTQNIDNTGSQTTKNTGTQKTVNTGTQTNDTVIHNLNEYTEHVIGKRGSADYSDMILKFRDTILNIDMMIIHELQNLFMLVY